jgi:hypothetical protein
MLMVGFKLFDCAGPPGQTSGRDPSTAGRYLADYLARMQDRQIQRLLGRANQAARTQREGQT